MNCFLTQNVFVLFLIRVLLIFSVSILVTNISIEILLLSGQMRNCFSVPGTDQRCFLSA
jgi:hypothetical protein